MFFRLYLSAFNLAIFSAVLEISVARTEIKGKFFASEIAMFPQPVPMSRREKLFGKEVDCVAKKPLRSPSGHGSSECNERESEGEHRAAIASLGQLTAGFLIRAMEKLPVYYTCFVRPTRADFSERPTHTKIKMPLFFLAGIRVKAITIVKF